MGNTRVLFGSLVAGFVGVAACSEPASAQQMSAPQVVQNAKEVSLKSSTPEAITVDCPEGTKVLGGGGGTEVFGATNFAMVWSMPITGQKVEGWTVGIVNRALTTKKGTISAFAVCGKFQ